MGVMFALGLGVVVGAVAGFPAGKHYTLFRLEKDLAVGHWGNARQHWGKAVGPVGLFLLVIVAGTLIMMFGS